jgi:hypothetical protein
LPACTLFLTEKSSPILAGGTVLKCLGGVFDAYPRLKVILGHLGETLPFLVWRVDHALARPGAKTLSFREAFCGHFYITTSGNFSNPALLCCVMEMGIDRILRVNGMPLGWCSSTTLYGRIPLGQKIESVERWGIVPVRRSLGKRWTNYTLRKRRILR